MASREEVVEKVRKLWRLADHPNTPSAEATAATEQAQRLMAKYVIDEMTLAEADSKGRSEAVVLSNIRITEEGRKPLVKDQRIALSWVVARQNRCRAIVRSLDESVDVDSGVRVPAGVFLTVMGYQSDVSLVRELYFGLAMDMVGAVMDEPSQRPNYQAEFASGYVTRIDERLSGIGKRIEDTAGSLLPVLVKRGEEVQSAFDKMFPPDQIKRVQVTRRNYDPNARERGRRAADRAEIGQTKLPTNRKAIES